VVSTAVAQYPLGKLSGTVSGPGGAKPAEVRVRLSRNGPRGLVRETTPSARGEFGFVALPPGAYTLDVFISGKQAYRRSRLEIRSATTLELNVTLASSGGSGSATSRRRYPLERDAGWGTEFSEASGGELPNAGNIWSLLESQAPSTVTNRLDVGGLETGVPALFGAVGASWTENQYLLNGFDVTDPYIPGRPLLDPDLDTVREFQVMAVAKPSFSAGSGVALELANPEPPRSPHGSTRLLYSGRAMQSNNVDARLRSLGFPGPERLNHLVDGNAEVGGKLPLAAAPWPALVCVSTRQLSKGLGGFAAPIHVAVDRALAQFTPFERGVQGLNLLYAGQHTFNSHEDAQPRIEPSATTRGNDNFHQFQARWHRMPHRSSLLALGFGVVHAVVSSGLQSHVVGTGTLDLPLMTRSGPAPLSFTGSRSRYQVNGLFETLRDGAAGSHSLDVGADWGRSYVSNRWDALGDSEQILVEGVGAEVTRWNTPAQTRQQIQNLALFAQDAWRPFGWLRLPVGLRLEASSGRARGAPNGIHWAALQPRAGLVLPLARSRLVVRASWSRYGHLLQGRYLDFGNSAALGGRVFRWQDLNGDGQAQPQEVTQLLQVFGGRYSALDSGLTQPFTDELSVGLDGSLVMGLRAGVRFLRRDDHRLIALRNAGVPFSSYSPVNVLDPGNDGIPGTPDDQVLTLYNRNRSALGRDFFVLTNPPGDRASAKGFEVRLTKPLLRLWQFSASFTALQTLAPTSPGNSVLENDTGSVGSLYTDPNTLLFDTSRTYFDRAFIGKARGCYAAPHGFRLGVVAKYYDGLSFGRLLFVNGFNQGPFFVRATLRGHPGGFQTQFNSTLDLRVSREFALRRGQLSAYLDLFNILNMNRNTLEADLTGPTFQSRVPLAVESPRVGRLGLEWRF